MSSGKVPVDRLKNQSESGLDIRPNTHQETALRVLATNPGTAYRPKQIEVETDIPEGSAAKVLSRLAEKEAVKSFEGYYHINKSMMSEVRTLLGDIHQRQVMAEVLENENNAEKTTETSENGRVSQEKIDEELENLEEQI